MDRLLIERVDQVVAEFQQRVHRQASQIDPSTPGVLLDLERMLFGLLMQVGAALVAAFVDAFHRDAGFVHACQQQAKIPGHRLWGWRWTRICDLFGGRHRVRTPYVGLDPQHQRGRRRASGRRGPSGRGSYPVLEVLGCRVNATPTLLSEAARQLSWGPSEQAALERLGDRGIRLTNYTLRRMAYHLAGEGQRARDSALEAGALPPGTQGESLQGKRVVVCFDGGRVRTRTRGRGRRRKNGYRGYRRPWRAPRLLVIYSLDEKGRKKRHELPLYDGVLTSAEALFRLLTAYLVALGVWQATQVIFVADGAPEHWQGVARLREALELDPARVVEVLDWAHAIEHLTKVADAYGSWSEKRRTRWLKTQRKRLKQGQIKAVLQALNVLCRGRQKKTVGREIAFFEQHAHRMRYGAFRKNAIPLGSGAVESALRRIVNLRMKGPGIFWIPEHAQEMLYLRCQLLSRRWDAFIRALLCPQQAINPASQNQTIPLQTRKAA